MRKAAARSDSVVVTAMLQWGRNLTVAEGVELGMDGDNMVLLQWGRNLTVAEGGADMYDLGQVEKLQWGRNLTVAEGAAPSPSPRSEWRFNGAAT